jgi:hypothetical protein
MDNRLDMQNQQALINRSSVLRRVGIVSAGIGLGSMLACLFLKALGGNAEKSSKLFSDHIVNDRGTDQRKAAKLMHNLRDRAFEASDEKLAIALRRPLAEVTAWSAGRELIDDDVVMKGSRNCPAPWCAHRVRAYHLESAI